MDNNTQPFPYKTLSIPASSSEFRGSASSATTPLLQTHLIPASSSEFRGSASSATTPLLHKKKIRRILVFDVETTGLIPNNDPITKKNQPIENMPYIIQLSFIVFNLYDYKLERVFNAYIKIKEPEKITKEITDLTGITREKCENYGILIKDALLEFYNEYIQSDYVIAHNISFDRRMIMFEIERNYVELELKAENILNIFNPIFCKLKNIENYCTMMSSINICNIIVERKTNSNSFVKDSRVSRLSSCGDYTSSTKIENNMLGVEASSSSLLQKKMYKKFPKLSELYFCLFQSNPANLHNALVDTLVCLRCFLKIKLNYEIHNRKYDHMLESIMKIV